MLIRIHCFDNVTAILFVVAISGYDQCLIEDRASVIIRNIYTLRSLTNLLQIESSMNTDNNSS